ncbi:MAG: histidine kinase [Cyanosarcina radialis HA8281-LM2]|jgi:two-component system clock-associated histidine kinase SasA|nr:histidine kinase [Cyanosarcina radialis HA8281-LM2]
MQAVPKRLNHSKVSLQLLLFVDKRSGSRELQTIRACLDRLQADRPFELQIVDVGQQPYLAEHFRLVATPALIKISPEPRQTLAGSNLVEQLETWWSRWISGIKDVEADLDGSAETISSTTDGNGSVACTAEVMQLADEIFQLKQEKTELLEQLQFKDRVIALLAHDLRNPLTAVTLALGTLELAQNSIGDFALNLKPGLMEQLIQQSRAQIRSMDRLIADILQAARGSSAELRIQPHKLELGSLCRDVVLQMQEGMQNKSQKIEVDIPQDLPFVHADGERVRQVLVNLLDNAIKYTPEGGTIKLAVLHRTTGKIQVLVADDGPGIPEAESDRIFEDRFRLERDRDRDGYGLGLSLCQRIVRSHYGRIWVESVPGQGSCFNFTLPVYR